MNEINVFIPAAGLGERLRPATDHIPKPLLPVLGEPAIERVIERILCIPFQRIGINAHYKRELMLEWLETCRVRDRIDLFEEEEILGTGGALKNAGGLLMRRGFLVHNADVISDIDLNSLIAFHESSGNLATLAVHDYPRFNGLCIDDAGRLASVAESGESEHTVAFTGIAVYAPRFLGFLPSGRSSVVDGWLKAISYGERIGTLDFTGCYWSDIGTPDAYAAAVFRALRSEGEVIRIDETVASHGDTRISGNVVIEKKCVIGRGVSLKNCIVLPGSTVSDGMEVHNCILGNDFRIAIDEENVFSVPGRDGLRLIGSGASDRKYFRTTKDGEPAVLMQCGADDPDFARHMEYSAFFRRCSVPVPDLYHYDPQDKTALFEDCGDISLYSWLRATRLPGEIRKMYRGAIKALVAIHAITADQARECSVRDRVFDCAHFRWETEYFMRWFASASGRLTEHDAAAVKGEFERLAATADSFPKGVMHRDFQSQNIMVRDDGTIRVIDYQGARIGPRGYDAASLLWDPYYRLADELREELLGYYREMMRKKAGGNFREDQFIDSLPACRLQRHMQALGAYGFLSSVKGKAFFLKYAPEGLRLLKEDASLMKAAFPEICKMVFKL